MGALSWSNNVGAIQSQEDSLSGAAASFIDTVLNELFFWNMSDLKSFESILKVEFPEDRLTYQKCILTFHPQSADEAARLFKLANRHGQKLYITGFGNHIDPIGQPFVNLVSIRTDRLNTMFEIAPEDFYVTVGSGYPLREINRQLEEIQLMLPHSDFPYVGSVGGAIATGLTGELSGREIPLKKYFVKAQIVTPQGDIITPGSVCFKSVSGYDLVKIFCRSWGLLGLIVSATLRVVPASAASEFAAMKMRAVDRKRFLAGLSETSTDADAIYSRKIKLKFDPRSVLPVV
ncbi:MAG TPA: FAD-binding oxidoreductase [Candidatus Deferrimicrobium sp.]|nr:FAD-binding oxidoreductase [Candidatus Deferrimicrobium sp.]